MPRRTIHTLTWSSENNAYELTTEAQPSQHFHMEDEHAWLAWLAMHTSFVFQGHAGSLRAYKEARPRGEDYWYAYSFADQRLHKRYLGRSSALSFAHLEEVAASLQEQRSLSAQVVAPQAAMALEDSAAFPFLYSSLQVPRVPRALVERPRLLKQLDAALSHPLTLVSASAGYGKTTLLSTWAVQQPQPVAWLSLEPLDNDPTRFWVSLLLALRTCLPEVGEAALALLQSSPSMTMAPILTVLLNELATLPGEMVLILDDYHVIEEQALHEAIFFFLEHLPTPLHVIVSTRIDPTVPLARWRARGRMMEIRVADLRFTTTEASLFLTEAMGLSLSQEQSGMLHRRTEGWIAGLQLTALSLQKQDDPSSFLERLRGDHRYLLDYVQEEILSHQDDSIQHFLLRICILPRMNSSLCQAVIGNSASQQMLEALERCNLFLVPLDEQRQWYRFHDLFREALLARLQAIEPEVAPTLYERAAHWYEHHALLPEAIDALLHAGSYARAASLIERSIDPKNLRNAYHTLCRWLRQIPEEMMRTQPALSFLYALSIMFTSLRRDPASWERIEPLLQWAERGFEAVSQQERLGDALELHAELAFFQEDIPGMMTMARRASPLLSEHNLMYSTNLLTIGYEQLLTGNVDAAWQNCLQGYRLCESRGNYTGTIGAANLLGEICFAQGELRHAAFYYNQTLAYARKDAEIFQHQFVTGTGDREPFFVSWAYHNLARLSYEWNDLEAAQQYLSQARAPEEAPEAEIHVLTSGSLILPYVLLRCGEQAQAERLLETWERQARFPWAYRTIRAAQARLQLALGNLPAVEQWARTREHSFGFPIREHDRELPYVNQEEEALLLIRLYLAQERAEEAMQALVPWKEKAEVQGRLRTLLEILILESLAFFVAGEMSQARSTLIQALRMARPENYQRLFLDGGQTLAALVRSTLEEIREPELSAYAHRLLEAFEREQEPLSTSVTQEPPVLLDPLTLQERRVLGLLAEGASNQEIANHLVITLATAKKHVSNLLSKLGARNRVEALARAREQHLFDEH